MPVSADALETLVSILVWVNRPVTTEGLIFKVTPFPFEVEMFELNILIPVPPLKAPPAPIAHDAAVEVALKLPLLWANTNPDPNTAISTASASFFTDSSLTF